MATNNIVKIKRLPSLTAVDDIIVAHFWDFSGDPPPSAKFVATMIDSDFESTTGLICQSRYQWSDVSMD